MKKVRVGIIGYGFRAAGIVWHLLQLPDMFEVVAVCDVREERLAEAREVGQFATYADYRELLAGESLDAVVVATPQDSHCEITLAALAAGAGVYCEKPMALRLTDCDAMIAAAADSGKLLMIGQQMRHSVHLLTLAKMVSDGQVGDPGLIWCREFRNPFPATMRWAFDKTRSGGLLVEKSCHHFDVFNWLADSRPVRVFASGGAAVHQRIFGTRSTIADHAAVVVEYESGCRASYELCMFAGAPDEVEYGLGPHIREIGVIGSGGMLRTEGFDLGRSKIEQRWPHNHETVLHDVPGDPPPEERTPHNQTGAGIFYEFHECLTTGRPPFPDGAVGRGALAVALAAEQSMATGQPVKL